MSHQNQRHQANLVTGAEFRDNHADISAEKVVDAFKMGRQVLPAMSPEGLREFANVLEEAKAAGDFVRVKGKPTVEEAFQAVLEKHDPDYERDSVADTLVGKYFEEHLDKMVILDGKLMWNPESAPSIHVDENDLPTGCGKNVWQFREQVDTINFLLKKGITVGLTVTVEYPTVEEAIEELLKVYDADHDPEDAMESVLSHQLQAVRDHIEVACLNDGTRVLRFSNEFAGAGGLTGGGMPSTGSLDEDAQKVVLEVWQRLREGVLLERTPW